VLVWRLKEEKTCEECQSMVKYKVAGAEWKYLDVNEHWVTSLFGLVCG